MTNNALKLRVGARAAAERSSEISSEIARKSFKKNRHQGEISAIFVRSVRVSTLEICSKKLVVAISKSHLGNVAQIGINSATHVQVTKFPAVFWMYFCASVFHGFISLRGPSRFVASAQAAAILRAPCCRAASVGVHASPWQLREIAAVSQRAAALKWK